MDLGNSSQMTFKSSNRGFNWQKGFVDFQNKGFFLHFQV